jgi:integrase/recombinase XerC
MLEKFETYLSVERRLSAHTLTAYMKDLEQFLNFALVQSENELPELTHQVVRSWIVDLINSGATNRSVNRKLSSLRTFFKWSLKEDLVQVNPMLRVKGPKQGKRLPEFVKKEELDIGKVEPLFSGDWSGKRDQLMIELFYQTGIRLSELIELKRSSLLNDAIKVLGKRNKERIIPITNRLQNQLVELSQSDINVSSGSTHIFLTDKGNKLYPKFVYRKVNYYLSLLTNLQKKSPHVLRHTFATHMLNNGAGLETLKEVLGHANLSATQVYTHNSFEELSKIYKLAHPRGHKK